MVIDRDTTHPDGFRHFLIGHLTEETQTEDLEELTRRALEELQKLPPPKREPDAPEPAPAAEEAKENE